MSKMLELKLEDDLISSNKDIFAQELTEVIKPLFTGLEHPTRYSVITANILEKSNRTPFPRQARLINAATEYIKKKKNKSLIISSEMGTGKTQLAINISQDDKFSVNFILCPPHLVDKWEDEILGVYKKEYHKKIKIIKVSRWEDLSLYTKRDMRKDGVKYYFIISRESAKLGYPKQTAVNVRYKTLTVEKNLDGQTFMIKQRAQVATCPDCDATLKEEEDGVLDLSDTSVKTGIPYKCECGCVLRQVDKSVSPKMQTRISIAEYVKRTWTKGAIDLLVVDEAHEYKGGATGQGNALAQLCSMSKKIVGLTGTLLNGYASSLFYLLYRFNPHLMNKTLGYDYKQLQLFVETYGAHEEVVQAKEVSYEGVVTKMGKRMNIKEKPKISPYLLSVLLDMTIFLRLDEIKIPDQGLPDYDESIELVDMEEELRKPYMDYLGEISSKIRKDKRFLGNLATDAIAVPDMPFRVHSAQGELFYEPPFSREEFGYTNKEKRALELVKSELSQGRKVLLYVHFSNKGVADDLLKMLEKELPQYIHKFLSPTINANKRQAWIEKNPSDVLICNPELVKTGLDLLQFPTIIFYESTYNVFTLKQASRRSWRIGQRENVKVIFMAYSNTPQHKALELIGAKVGAANSLEGRLSGDDDLSSMGDDEDNIQLALAKAILKGESASKDIQMNSIKNFGNDRDYDAFEQYYINVLKEYKDKNVVLEDKSLFSDAYEISSNGNDFEHDKEMQMFKTMAKELLEQHTDKTLYGKENIFVDSKGKEQITTSYKGCGHCFEICDDYIDGKFKGLSYSAKRESNMKITNCIEIYRVSYINKVPFMPVKNSEVFLPIDIFHKLVKECSGDYLQLSKLLKNFVETSKNLNITTENEPIFDSLLDYDGEITSNKFFYYKGKGKNTQKVEISTDDILMSIPKEELASGVQLSLF